VSVKNVRLEGGKIIVTTSRCASVFGVSREAVRLWGKAGCPQSERGWWDLDEVVKWRMGVEQGAAAEQSKESWPKLKIRAEAEYKAAKAEQEKIRLQGMKKDFVPFTDVKFSWAERLTVFRVNMFAWIHTLPGILEGMSRAEIEEQLEGEIRNLWEAFSRDGPYTPRGDAAVADEKVDAFFGGPASGADDQSLAALPADEDEDMEDADAEKD